MHSQLVTKKSMYESLYEGGSTRALIGMRFEYSKKKENAHLEADFIGEACREVLLHILHKHLEHTNAITHPKKDECKIHNASIRAVRDPSHFNPRRQDKG